MNYIKAINFDLVEIILSYLEYKDTQIVSEIFKIKLNYKNLFKYRFLKLYDDIINLSKYDKSIIINWKIIDKDINKENYK